MAQGEEEITLPGPVGPPANFKNFYYCDDLTADQGLTNVPIGAVQVNTNSCIPPACYPILIPVSNKVAGQIVYTTSGPYATFQESWKNTVPSPNGGCRKPLSQPTPAQTYIRYSPCSGCPDDAFTSNAPTNGLNLDGQTVSFPGGNTPTCCFTALLVLGQPGSPVDVTFNWDNNPPQIITYNDCDTCQGSFSGDGFISGNGTGNIECPPEEAITLSDGVYLGIESFDCCKPDVLNDDNVWWDEKNGQCKTHTQTLSCVFESYIFNELENNITQIIGVNTVGDEVILSQNCCSEELIGFPVNYNSELNLCVRTQTEETPNIPTITLNEDIIDASDCDDLIVSAKIFFNQPEEICAQNLSCFLLPDNPNVGVEQIAIFDLLSDGYNVWVDLAARFNNVSGNPFNLNLVFDGLTDCCEYDLLFDNVRVDCFDEQERVFIDNQKCVGFDLAKVIDNKKSWVYNVGRPEVGDSEIDNIIRNKGDRTLLEKFGYVNRKFAPSPDAQIPWRYTNYYEQSNILEPHSKSVINSKELYLTFNMCEADKCLLYTYLSHDDGDIVDDDEGKVIVETERVIKNLLQLEAYKNKFQEFWVRMIEQFVPATTIFVSGEKWCNNDKLICTEFEECDYDYEYVESEITVIEYGTDFNPDDNHEDNGGDATDGPKNDIPIDNDSDGNPRNSEDGPIFEDGITVIATEGEPSGDTTITDSRPFTGPNPRLRAQINAFNSKVNRGQPQKEFV